MLTPLMASAFSFMCQARALSSLFLNTTNNSLQALLHNQSVAAHSLSIAPPSSRCLQVECSHAPISSLLVCRATDAPSFSITVCANPPFKGTFQASSRLFLPYSIASAPLTLPPILSFVRGVFFARASRIIQPPARWPCSHDGRRAHHSLSAPTPSQPR